MSRCTTTLCRDWLECLLKRYDLPLPAAHRTETKPTKYFANRFVERLVSPPWHTPYLDAALLELTIAGVRGWSKSTASHANVDVEMNGDIVYATYVGAAVVCHISFTLCTIPPHFQLSTCGMACKAALGPSEEDGLLVKILRLHGAIPFVRGNVPQCL